MYMNNFLYLVVFFMVIMMFMIKKNFLLMSLLYLEFMVVSVLIISYMMFSLMNKEFIMLYLMVFMVCESVLGLSMLVLINRFYKNDKISILDMVNY